MGELGFNDQVGSGERASDRFTRLGSFETTAATRKDRNEDTAGVRELGSFTPQRWQICCFQAKDLVDPVLKMFAIGKTLGRHVLALPYSIVCAIWDRVRRKIGHLWWVLKHFWLQILLSLMLTCAEAFYVRIFLWPLTSHISSSVETVRNVILPVLGTISWYFNFYIIYEVLLSLNHMLSEVIVFISILILSYYQAPPLAFAVSTMLQIFGFFLVAFSGNFETPLKLRIKTKCGPKTRKFLVKSLRMKYFACSNPFEKKVMETDHFLTTGTHLYTRGFSLGSVAGLDRSRPRDKVEKCEAGPLHTLFTIEGVAAGILVRTGPLLEEQRELLEYMAHHPEACFAKEVHGSRGKYWPIEEYPKLLNQEIFVCRFSPVALSSSSEEESAGVQMF